MTRKTSFQLKAEFCREYQLGIRTEVGGIESDIVPLSEKLVTKIENPEYYILPNFDVRGTLQGARLSWEHRSVTDEICRQLLQTIEKAFIFFCNFVHYKSKQRYSTARTGRRQQTTIISAHHAQTTDEPNKKSLRPCYFRSCIESYRVKLCQENAEDKICYEKQIIPVSEIVNDVVANLKMCSVYTVDIFPLYRKSEIRTKTVKFRTQSPIQNPLNVQISVDTAKDKVNFSWDKVKCASGYKVLQKLENSDSADWTFLTTKLQLDLDSPEPCSTIRYVYSLFFHNFLLCIRVDSITSWWLALLYFNHICFDSRFKR